jgi:hypothetical protein
MSSAHELLEQHEHAGHVAHGEAHAAHGAEGGGRASAAQWSALLVAFLAAGLALSEQGAKHAEIRVQQFSIDAADAWSQYQAKSTRAAIAKDLAGVVAALEAGSEPAAAGRRERVLEELRRDQERYENDPKDGKEAVAHRAKELEHGREHALEETHAYHNGSAAMQLGIVLATASAITRSRLLLVMALGFGAAGAVLSLLGYVAPEYGAMF